MPSLQTVSSDSRYDYGSEDLIRFQFCSLLAQIEIASCFRNDVESHIGGCSTQPVSRLVDVSIGADVPLVFGMEFPTYWW